MVWIAGRHRWCLWVFFKLKWSFDLWSIRGAKKHFYVDVRSPISTTVISVEIQALCGAIPILEEIEVPCKCLLITKKTFHLYSIFTPQHKVVGKFVAKNNNSSHAICEQTVDINARIRKWSWFSEATTWRRRFLPTNWNEWSTPSTKLFPCNSFSCGFC